jgi:hypothetical protein
MADPSASDANASPLAALSAWQGLGEAQFEALQQLARRSSSAAVETSERDAASAVLAWFDRCISVHHRVQEDTLFPELVESMAGSDPVCLRELAATATAGHRAVESLWRNLRPACLALSRGVTATLEADVAMALVEACRANFERAARDLIPMAERLLDEAALARLQARLENLTSTD